MQWRYCRSRENFEIQESIRCTSTDNYGQNRRVFVSRLCDGVADCNDAEDEIGGLGECQTIGKGRFEKF